MFSRYLFLNKTDTGYFYRKKVIVGVVKIFLRQTKSDHVYVCIQEQNIRKIVKYIMNLADKSNFYI